MKNVLICVHKILQSAGGLLFSLIISPFILFVIFVDLVYTITMSPWYHE